MKTACVITATYPLENGAGIFVRDHCYMLSRAGYRVTVLYSKSVNPFKGRKLYQRIKHIQDGEITVYVKESYRFLETYTVPLVKHSIISTVDSMFRDYIRENGLPNCVISHFSFPSGFGGVYISKKYGIPYISIEHLSIFLSKKKPWLNTTLKFVVNNANAFVCVSDGLREGIVRRTETSREIMVIPNPIDSLFTYTKKAKTDTFTFFSAGRLVKGKNYDTLIRAFAQSMYKKNAFLRIAGKGEEFNNLRKLITSLNIEDQIILLGELTREELLKEYTDCDCFVLLSLAETFGIVYREAMAVGRPIITTPTKGASFGWNNEFGIMLKGFSLKEASDALLNMYQNVDNFDGVSISKSILSTYSEDVICTRYDEIIMSIINNVKKGTI